MADRFHVQFTENSREVLDASEAFLSSQPVAHNVVSTILNEMAPHPGTGRFWWVTDAHGVCAVALQFPGGDLATLTPTSSGALTALVEAMATALPGLSGVMGEAGVAAYFAGLWSEVVGVAAWPDEGGRLYRLGRLRAPEKVPGVLRLAIPEDEELVIAWARAFRGETGDTGDPAPEALHRLGSRRLWLWEDGEPVAMAGAPPAAFGVVRVGWVYTPPEHRRRGYGAAVTAALSQHALDTEADTCILYTQLHNPTSNGIYRGLGYRAVAETMRYAFGVETRARR